MNNKRVYILVVMSLLGMLAAVFSGCGRTEEQQQAIEDKSIEARDYFNEKYGSNIEITESDYCWNSGLFGRDYKDDFMQFKTSESDVILLDLRNSMFYDNHQCEEIHKAINEYCDKVIWKGIEHINQGITAYCTDLNANYSGENTEFYHNHYVGNIDEFLQNERILFRNVSGIVTSDEKAIEIAEKYTELFECNYLQLFIVDEDSYATLDASEKIKEGNPACKKVVTIKSNIVYTLEQNYIEVLPGVYFMAKDFTLEDSDIILKPSGITKEELSDKWNELQSKEETAAKENKSMYHMKKYNFVPVGDIYEVQLSDRVKNQLNDIYIKGVFYSDSSICDSADNLMLVVLDNGKGKIDIQRIPIGYDGTINNLFYENNQYVFLGIAKEIE